MQSSEPTHLSFPLIQGSSKDPKRKNIFHYGTLLITGIWCPLRSQSSLPLENRPTFSKEQ